MAKEFDKTKLKRSIAQLMESECCDSEYLEKLSKLWPECDNTIVDILEILHRDDITVANAKVILQDTYKLMRLGATL